MKDPKDRVILKLSSLLELGDKVLATIEVNSIGKSYVDIGLFSEFRAASLSFISNLIGKNENYYSDFDTTVTQTWAASSTEKGIGILKAIKADVESGWLIKFKDIIASDIFTDFLEMAEHLLEKKYKDAAAVMIGGVLEEQLRNLCTKNNIPTTEIKSGKEKFKEANTLNSELKSSSIYERLENKQVTEWLDLRNSAAHGDYSKYNQEDVKNMYSGVLNFIAKTNN